MPIDAKDRRALDRDGFLLLRGAFDEARLRALRAGVDNLIARARAGVARRVRSSATSCLIGVALRTRLS